MKAYMVTVSHPIEAHQLVTGANALDAVAKVLSRLGLIYGSARFKVIGL